MMTYFRTIPGYFELYTGHVELCAALSASFVEGDNFGSYQVVPRCELWRDGKQVLSWMTED